MLQQGIYKLINQEIDYEMECKNVKSLFLGIVIANDFFAPYSSTKSLLNKFSSGDREIFTINADSFKEVTPNHFSWLKEPEPAISTFVSWLRKKRIG